MAVSNTARRSNQDRHTQQELQQRALQTINYCYPGTNAQIAARIVRNACRRLRGSSMWGQNDLLKEVHREAGHLRLALQNFSPSPRQEPYLSYENYRIAPGGQPDARPWQICSGTNPIRLA